MDVPTPLKMAMQEEGRQVVNGQFWHCQMYPPFVPNRQRREAGQADSDRIFGLEGGLLFSLPQLDLLPKGGHFGSVSFSSENDGFHPEGCSPYMNVSKGTPFRDRELSLKLSLRKANP